MTLHLSQGEARDFRPPLWVGRAPFNVVLHTIHVDRLRLDQKLQELVIARGVTIFHDKALSVEKRGMRIVSIQTASGAQFDSPWFIDASRFVYHSAFLAREFNLPVIAYGPRKVCLWSYFTAPLAHEGTTIYMDPVRREYQDWIWEIPIGPETLSVGYVTTGEATKKMRDQGHSVEDILRLQLAGFPRLASLSQKDAGAVPRVTSFSCRTYRGVTGPNWIIAGEAASMVDPITSNGVTSALRHAQEASALIAAARGKSELSYLARKSYSMRVLQLGRFFNGGIESLVYDWPVRDRLGISAGRDDLHGCCMEHERSVLAIAAAWRSVNRDLWRTAERPARGRLGALPALRFPWSPLGCVRQTVARPSPQTFGNKGEGGPVAGPAFAAGGAQAAVQNVGGCSLMVAVPNFAAFPASPIEQLVDFCGGCSGQGE